MARSTLALGALVAASGVALAACNVAVGGGAAVLVGGSAVLASQCYDRVHITVRDATGSATCDATVSVVDAEGDARTLQPCYSAALTEGSWTIRAEKAGYTPMTTSVVIPEHEDCPYYTHSIDLSLTPVGARAAMNQPADVARARAAAAASEPEEEKPAGPPRKAFEMLSAPAPTTPPAAPSPAPAATPAPAAPAPAPSPAAPAPPPAPSPTP